jgi:argininosuccinate lyase
LRFPHCGRENILKIMDEVSGRLKRSFICRNNTGHHHAGFTHAQPAQPTILGHYCSDWPTLWGRIWSG